MRCVDIHSHLNFSQFDSDREEIIQRMEELGIGTITVGTSAKTSEEAVSLAQTHDHIFATIGIHPTDDEPLPDVLFEKLVADPKVVAIGECGLDYYRDVSEEQKQAQKDLFEAHIAFAKKHNRPLMLHARPQKGTMDAYEDMLNMLEAAGEVTGNVHFFVGTIPIARRFLDLGFTMSFDGPVTFTREYDAVIQFIPETMLHAETDAPFAAPEPYRGKRSEPLHVELIISTLAKIRGVDEEVFRKQLLQNAGRVFGVPVANS